MYILDSFDELVCLPAPAIFPLSDTLSIPSIPSGEFTLWDKKAIII
jgi:hypothetical protein